MIQKRFTPNVNARRWFWVIATVIGIFVGLGISQVVQLHEATAESHDDDLSELAAELDAIKAKHRMLQARWQSELLAQIVPTLADESDDVRHEYVDFLEEIGSPGIAALVAILQDPDKDVREEAVEALGEIGEDLAKNGQSTDTIRDALIASVNDSSRKVRTNAINELSDIRAASTETFTALIGVLSDGSKSVRASAEETLIELGEHAPMTITPMLAAALTNSASAVTRGHVVDVLGGIGEELVDDGNSGEMVVEPLLSALHDTAEDVRRNAADELGEMRATSSDVQAALTQALDDNSEAVRDAAKKALRRIEKAK